MTIKNWKKSLYSTCKKVYGANIFFFCVGERFKIKSIVCFICLSGDELYQDLKRKANLKTKMGTKNKKYCIKNLI